MEMQVLELSAEEAAYQEAMEGTFLSACRALHPSWAVPTYLALNPVMGRPFFARYYPVIWTVVMDLTSGFPADHAVRSQALTVQAMALALHLIDDHLSDGQMAATHGLLHLRTLCWNRFAESGKALTQGRPEAVKFWEETLDGYFAAIGVRDRIRDLAEYEAVFKRQIGTWLLAPALVAGETGACAAAEVRSLIEEFSLAWRFVDDLQDVEENLLNGETSAVTLAAVEAPVAGPPSDRIAEFLTRKAEGCLSRATELAVKAGLPRTLRHLRGITLILPAKGAVR
jgi:hypothetical protein